MSESVTFGNVTKPAIDRQIVVKPESHGWQYYGPRDELLALIFHNVLGKASTTFQYFSNPNEPHGYNALTDWGVCNSIDGPLDGMIIQWNDPDEPNNPTTRRPRSPYASGGVGPKVGDGPALLALCQSRGLNLNQATEAIEISRFRNYDPVSPKCLASIIALAAWRVDTKARVRWDQWPQNRFGVQMTETHKELGKPECDALDVIGEVILGVREMLRHYQTRGKPVPVPVFVRPQPIPALGAWDGKPRAVGTARFWAVRTTLTAKATLEAHLYADLKSPQVREPLVTGDEFAVDYLVYPATGGRWAYTPTGARIYLPAGSIEPNIMVTPS